MELLTDRNAGASRVFSGPGEMRALCRALDWATTPLGPVAAWPASLRTAAGLVLAAQIPMIVLWGPELVQLYNDGYREVMGTRHPAGLGQPTRECWPEVWAFNAPLYEGVMRRGEAYSFEDQPLVIERHGQAEQAFFTLGYGPVPGDDGAPGGVLVTVFETTAQARARGERESERERWLEESETARAEIEAVLARAEAAEHRLQTVFAQAPALVAVTEGPEHRFVLANPAYEERIGRGALVGRTIREAVPDLEAHGIFALLDEVYATGTPFVSTEHRTVLHRETGSAAEPYEGWYNFVYQPLMDAAGAVTGVLQHAVEVTVQVRARAVAEAAQHEAEQAGQRAAAVLASIADAFYLLDREWRFTHVNDAAEPLLQTTRDALLGRTLWEAFPDVVGSVFEGPYREAMASGRVTSAEAYFPPLGTWFDVHSYPWPGGLMVHFRDIGARKAAEAERERLLADAQAARGEAEAANRAKGDFLAVMSHELRTPLNAIGGYAELMELGIHGPVTPEQARALARIQQSQRHLLGLINGVLNYSRVEAGAVHYAVDDVPIDEVLATCEALVAPQARGKRIALEFAGCAGTIQARADMEKVQQIVLNLLSNAVKFTEPDGVVSLTCESDDAHVRIHVADNGRGISADQLERIFQPFVQVDVKLTRTQEGTGLGLAISRDLARGMSGELTATSTAGVGSTFTLTLPRAH